MRFGIRVYSKEGVSIRECSGSDVNEELRRFGLEWKTADWAHDQTVLIVISPIVADEVDDLRRKVKGALEALEG